MSTDTTQRRWMGDTGQPVSLQSTRSRTGERIIVGLLWLCGAISILTTVGLILVLFIDASAFFREVSVFQFFTDTRWQPFGGLENGHFGVLPLLMGTLLVTAIAIVVAVPLGISSAIYLADYAPGGCGRSSSRRSRSSRVSPRSSWASSPPPS